MASYTTKTRLFGPITFDAPTADRDKIGHVWAQTENGKRAQICHGGGFRGDTVTATEKTLKTVAQKWLRQRRDQVRKNQRELTQ
jgi:ribosomal protein S12 methylthiotransferase accessory factor YcaO